MADWFDQQGPVNTTQPGGVPQNAPPPPVSDDAILAILHKYPTNNDGFRAAVEEINRTFGPGTATVLEHPTRLDKFQLRDGRVFDAMIAATGTSGQWVNRLTPETHGPGGGGGGAVGSLGALAGLGGFSPADAMRLSPGYDFRFNEGLKALGRSAAAKGTLLTGGTGKALTRYGQDYASGEFDKIFGRNLSLAQLGLNATNTGVNAGSNYAGNVGNLTGSYGANLANLYTGMGNVQGSGTIGQANAWRGTLGDIANMAGEVFRNRQRRPMDERPQPDERWIGG